MLLEHVYIIRNGASGESWNTKLYFCIVAIILCIIDWKQNKRKEYFWVLITGTIIWTLIEGVAQISGIRVIPDRVLFGYQLPLWISLPIQGCSEGAVFAVVGLFFTDRFMKKNTRLFWTILFAVGMVVFYIIIYAQKVPFKDVGGDVKSRRDIFSLPTLTIMIIFLILDVIWYRKNDKMHKRIIIWGIFMIIFGVVWTLSEFLANTRWVEIGLAPDSLARAPPIIEFLTFAWDCIVEFSLVFMPFLAIPLYFKYLKDKKTRSSI